MLDYFAGVCGMPPERWSASNWRRRKTEGQFLNLKVERFQPRATWWERYWEVHREIFVQTAEYRKRSNGAEQLQFGSSFNAHAKAFYIGMVAPLRRISTEVVKAKGDNAFRTSNLRHEILLVLGSLQWNVVLFLRMACLNELWPLRAVVICMLSS